MKRCFITILTILVSHTSFSQSKDSIIVAADAAIKVFTWDIQKEDRGSMMFLDVPFQQDGSDSLEYLTLTVAKDKAKPRPEFISVIIPGNVMQSNGIFITFSKTIKENGEWKMQMANGNPVRLPFEKCTGDCTARVVYGYATEEDGTKTDIFQKFLDYDHVLFLFIYPDGSHKSVAVPLFSFKEQYKGLL